MRLLRLVGASVHFEQAACYSEFNFGGAETEHRQTDPLVALSSERKWKVVNLATARVDHNHHEAARSAAPLDDKIMPSEIRSGLLFIVAEDTPTFAHTFPDSRSVHPLQWCFEERWDWFS